MPLQDVVATHLLSDRQARPHQAAAMQRADDSAGGRDALSMEAACELAMSRTHAESVGVSLFAHAKYDELTWLVVRGHLARFQGRRFPHRHSMCGVCFDLAAPQLFIKPHLHFQWMHQAGIGIREALVVPLRGKDGAFNGTLWVMSHAKDHVRFNAEDVATLEKIAARVDFSGVTRHD